MTDPAVEELAQRMQRANRVVFFSGAGISTASGIPCFTGTQGKRTVLNLAAEDFKRHPLDTYRVLWPFVRKVLSASPNFAHYFSAQLLKQRSIEAVITQNIDSLFAIAGAPYVWELHGNIIRGYCVNCRRPFQMKPIWEAFGETGEIPVSACCNSYIRPDIIFFDERISMFTWQNAQRLARGSDLMVVIGSSLEVSPANYLPELSKEIVIVNNDKTAFDHKAVLKIEEDIISVFTKLAGALSQK